MLALALMALLVVAPSSMAAAQKRVTGKVKAHKLSPKQKAAQRRALKRQLKRNPMLATRPGFLRKAALVDLRVPFTVRLNPADGSGSFAASDDQLEITWNDDTNPWPLGGGAPAGPQLATLSGSFTMEARWDGDTSGVGEPGSVETVQGGRATMSSSPLAISDFDPACNLGPQLTTDPASAIALTSGGPRYGLMNLFSRTFRGTLALRMTNFSSALAGSCGGAAASTPVIDNSGWLPMPIRLDGEMQASPSLTADGKLRFAKINIDDAVTPQDSTFAYLRACTGLVSCDPMQFAARLKIKKLTAEVLLGDVG